MRAKPIQINALAQQIQNEFAAAFVFGTEEGVIQQTAQKIARFIVPDLKDDFCVLKTDQTALKENPHFLTQEANTPSLLGGRKLIWVNAVDNNALPALQEVLSALQTDTFILLVGGSLPIKSALPAFCIDSDKILTIPCYAPTGGEVAQSISETLKENGFSCSADALGSLVQRLQDNTLFIPSELEKLMTYKGADTHITLPDVQAVITPNATATTDRLCLAVAGGDVEKADHLCALLLQDTNPVTLVRALSTYFHKLLQGVDLVMSGQSPAAAAQKLLRANQFAMKDAFATHLHKWKKDTLLHVLNSLFDLEKQTKTTGLPAPLLVQRLVLAITRTAKRF